MSAQKRSLRSVQKTTLSIFMSTALIACGGGSGGIEVLEADSSEEVSENEQPPIGAASSIPEQPNTPDTPSTVEQPEPNTPATSTEAPDNLPDTSIDAPNILPGTSTAATNNLPAISDARIEPESPTLLTGMTAVVDGLNTSSTATHAIEYAWRINSGNPIFTQQPTLPDYLFARGDQVSMEVLVSNSTHQISALSPEVTVGNSAPQVGTVEIRSANGYSTDELSVDIVGMSDADKDSINVTYLWYRNDVALTDQTDSLLPAGTATPGDSISVEITVSDGIDNIATRSTQIELQNPPSHFSMDDIPIEFTHGELGTFNAKFINDGGLEVLTEVVQAPVGVSYNSSTGEVSWTPSLPMSAPKQSFEVRFSSSDGLEETVQISVINEAVDLLLAQSGLGLPLHDYEFDVGDFDMDGKTEILSVDYTDKSVLTLEYNGKSFEMDWLYPFSVTNDDHIKSAWAYGENQTQIIVVTEKGVSVIESRSEPSQRVYQAYSEIMDSLYVDIDSDGQKELLLLISDSTIFKLSPEDWSATIFTDEINVFGDDDVLNLEVGNVDNDPALELVVGTGHVIDGNTREIEWEHISQFGENVSVGDIDGDGDSEIIASLPFGNVTSYDPIAKTSIWDYGIDDYCSLRLYNIDSDPQDELIAGPCGKGSLEIYDGSTGTMVLEQNIEILAGRGTVRNTTLTDLDKDNVLEIVTAVRTGYRSIKEVAVISLESNGASATGAALTGKPNSYSGVRAIGWDNTNNDEERAVFTIPNLNRSEYGHRIGLFSTEDEFIISESNGSNRDKSSTGIVVDSNGDGVSEAIVAVEDSRKFSVRHISLEDFTQTHTHTDFSGTGNESTADIESISLGTDLDGSKKAIISSTGGKFQIYDIASTQAEWTSGGLTGGWIVAAIALNKNPGFDVVVATGTELTVWRKGESGYSKIKTAGTSCDLLADVVVEAKQKIACVKSGYDDQNSSLAVFNTDLIKEAEFDFEFNVTAIKSNASGETIVGTAAAVPDPDYFYKRDYTLRTLNLTDGTNFPISGPLLGRVQSISILDNAKNSKPKMAVSTDSAMYLME